MLFNVADIPEDIAHKFAKCGLQITTAITIAFFGPDQKGNTYFVENIHADEVSLVQLMYGVCPIREGTPHMARCWRYHVRAGTFSQVSHAERGEKKAALELLGALI